jgi:ABC-type sugar transport system permease subunit
MMKWGRGLKRNVLPGLKLSLGVTLTYVAIIVLLPLSALVFKAASLGPAEYWAIISSPRAVASYRVTVLCALAATLFNVVFGLALAWVLTRYRFPGWRLVDAIVDLPFALPTAVAGIALTTLFSVNGWFGSAGIGGGGAIARRFRSRNLPQGHPAAFDTRSAGWSFAVLRTQPRRVWGNHLYCRQPAVLDGNHRTADLQPA